MTSWVNVFGGGPADPADVQYRAFTIAANTALQWPTDNEDQDNVTARRMDVTASASSLSLAMPSAAQAAVGQNVVIKNVGSNTFTVTDYGGNTIASIAAGVVKYIEVTDNSTDDGTWGVFTFGTGTSAADASVLAGAGLQSSATLLRQALSVTEIAASYTAMANDRATVLKYTGGVGTLSLTAAATLSNNWFIYVNNQGSGALTVDPNGAETIDGAATITISQGESCMIVCDGSNFVTVGRGRSITTSVTTLSLSVAGTGTTTLSSTQAAAQIQEFNGALTGARIVEYGTSPNFWYIYNNTSGAYTLTLRVNNLDAGVAITQGTRAIVTSNGANMTLAVSLTSGTVTSVATGTGLTGGPITTTGTISLANTAVTPGTYDVPLITVDAQGRLTAASQNFAASDIDRLSVAQTLTAAKRGAVTTLAYSATTTIDMSVTNNYETTLTGNVTFANPTNQVAGQSGVIRIIQGGSGSYTASFGNNFVFPNATAPTLSTAVGAYDCLAYYILASGKILVVVIPSIG